VSPSTESAPSLCKRSSFASLRRPDPLPVYAGTPPWRVILGRALEIEPRLRVMLHRTSYGFIPRPQHPPLPITFVVHLCSTRPSFTSHRPSRPRSGLLPSPSPTSLYPRSGQSGTPCIQPDLAPIRPRSICPDPIRPKSTPSPTLP
jgi:hypothetical protein